MTMTDTLREKAEELINSDAVDVFEDSNTGQAAALAAADLLIEWSTYDDAYIAANRARYTQAAVREVIHQLQQWAAKGCPDVAGTVPAKDLRG